MTEPSAEVMAGARAMVEDMDRRAKAGLPVDLLCSFAAGLAAVADTLPQPSDDGDWVLPSAVCAWDIARCKVHGQEYPKNAMSATNKQTLAPMVRAAIKQALYTIIGKGDAS